MLSRHIASSSRRSRALAYAMEPLEPRTLLATSLTISGLQTPAPATNVRVSVDAATDQSEMSVAVNPANPLNLVAFTHRIGASSTMATFYTFDGGNTWTQKIIDNTVDGVTGTFRFDPTLAFDRQGRLFVCYGVDPSGGTRRLVVIRSLDGGQTYGLTSTVATNSSLDKWIIGTGRDPVNPAQENVYLAYRVTAGSVTSIRLAASYNNGATWPVDTLVPDDAQAGSDFSSFGMPAVGPNGELYVIWDDYDLQPTNSQVKMAVSFNAGATFNNDSLVSLTPITRGNGNGFPTSVRYHISAQPDRGVLTVPSIAADRSGGPFGGRVYAAYTARGVGGTTDNTDVVVRYSDNNGSTWSAPVTVHSTANTASQFLPWLDVDRNSGAVTIAYYDTRNSGTNQLTEMWVSASGNGGVSWTESRFATAQSNQSLSNPSRYGGNYLEYIGIAAHDGTVHAVWADNRDLAADLEVYTARASLNSSIDGNVLTITGDPAAADVITVAPAGANPAYLDVFVNGVREFLGLSASLDSITIETGNGADQISVTGVAGGIALTIDAGGDDDSIVIERSGTSARPALVLSGLGDDVLQVNLASAGTSHAVIGYRDQFGSIEVNTGGTLNIRSLGALPDILVVTKNLSIFNTGIVDLFNSDLVIDYSTTSPLNAIEGYITSARGPGGTWLGTGLTSTDARTNASGNTTLGAIESSDYFSAHGGSTPFNGYTPDATAVLVKYTYYGDTDMNGFVDFDDYVRTDAGYNGGLSGWFNGDFDFGGFVDFDDYVLIDLGYNTQGPPL